MALIGEATLLYFYFKVWAFEPNPQFSKKRLAKQTQLITTDNRQPQPHFQKKREAEEAAENSSEESSDLSEAEAEVEGDKMDAEGGNNILFDLFLGFIEFYFSRAVQLKWWYRFYYNW